MKLIHDEKLINVRFVANDEEICLQDLYSETRNQLGNGREADRQATLEVGRRILNLLVTTPALAVKADKIDNRHKGQSQTHIWATQPTATAEFQPPQERSSGQSIAGVTNHPRITLTNWHTASNLYDLALHPKEGSLHVKRPTSL